MIIHFKEKAEYVQDVEYYRFLNKKEFVNSSLMQNVDIMLKYIVQANEKLKTEVISTSKDYLDNLRTIEQIKFGSVLILIFALFILIWLPYLKNLNEKIWMTKGILGNFNLNKHTFKIILTTIQA